MSVNTDSISIFQKQWAFTTADSEAPIVKTGSFGPCYVVTFTQDKYAALAHIDDTTQVETMQNIFTRFQENGVDPKEVRVIVTGGWKENASSFEWGEKVVAKIKEAGFENMNTALMHVKTPITAKSTQKDISKHYFIGLKVDARDGKTTFIHEMDAEHESKQHAINQRHGVAVMMGQLSMDQEFPLEEVMTPVD